MSTLENAVAQCKGIEAQTATEKIDLGQENKKLLDSFNTKLAGMEKGNSGAMGYLKSIVTKNVDGNSLRAALATDVGNTMRGVQKEGLFDACNNMGAKLREATSAAGNPKTADQYVASVARQNATEVAGRTNSNGNNVAMNDNFQ